MKVPPPPPSGPRYLVCHLPGFRLERCGWDARQPVVLVAEQKSALRVQACTARAAQAGVRPGLTLAAARALLPELAVELLEPDEEALDLAELSWQLSRFAPAVAPLPPDALVAELVSPRGGVAPAEDALLVAAAQRLRLLGHTARLVIADDLFAARVLAAWSSRDVVVPPGGLARALAPLPLQALEPSPRLERLLADLGLRSVGQLVALPASELAGRFGAEALRLRRLALGGLGSLPLAAREREEQLDVHWDLPAPVAAIEPLLFVLNRLCRELCARLEQRSEGLVSLVLVLHLEDAGVLRLSLRAGRPLRDPDRLSRLLRRRLEGLQLGAPVIVVGLETRPVPFAGAQAPLLVGGQPLEPIADVAARLADSLGPTALFTPRPRDRWRPEAAWSPEPAFDERGRFLEPGPARAARAVIPAATKHGAPDPDPAWPHESWRFALPMPRPALLLSEPRPVLLEPRLGAPRRVQLEGRWFQVRRSWGPELLSVEWWAAGLDRRYWALELDDGRGLWVFRELGHAFLHGLFDQGSPARTTMSGVVA
jgi:protein ImuB